MHRGAMCGPDYLPCGPQPASYTRALHLRASEGLIAPVRIRSRMNSGHTPVHIKTKRKQLDEPKLKHRKTAAWPRKHMRMAANGYLVRIVCHREDSFATLIQSHRCGQTQHAASATMPNRSHRPMGRKEKQTMAGDSTAVLLKSKC